MKQKRFNWVLFLCALLALSSLQCQFTNSLFSPDPTQTPPPVPLPQAQPQDLDQDQPPPPDNPVENQPGQEAEANFDLVGIWVSQTESDYGMMDTELILKRDEIFSQQATLGGLMTYDTGTYEVGEGYIHFTVEDHEPKVYQGKEMTWMHSFTYFYQFVDENTIQFEDRVIHATWTATRR